MARYQAIIAITIINVFMLYALCIVGACSVDMLIVLRTDLLVLFYVMLIILLQANN